MDNLVQYSPFLWDFCVSASLSFLPLGPSATQCPFWTSQDPWARWRHRLLLGGFVGMRGADTGVPIADYTSFAHNGGASLSRYACLSWKSRGTFGRRPCFSSTATHTGS